MRRRKAAERDSSGGSDSSKSDKKGKGKSGRSSDGGEETTDLSGAVGVIVKLVRFAIMSVAIAMVTGLFVAGDPLWGYRGKYTKLRTYLPYREKIFSLPELAMYNGRDEKKPIYIAILGDVYDVTEGRRIYGPGGYYSFFSGRDASRAYVTGCFKTHLTYDVRDFDDQQMSGLLAWKDFYDKHAKYYKVGRVVLPPLDASVPVPEPCEDPSAPK